MNESILRSSILIRMILTAVLTLLLLIPTVIVVNVIEERSSRRDSAVQEVSDKWGLPQTVTGPILTIPVKHYGKDEKGNEITLIDHLHILPDSLAIAGRLTTETRVRGIYEAILYNSRLDISGGFDIANIPILHQEGFTPLWNDAGITVGISDPRGIKDDVTMLSDGRSFPASSGVHWQDVVSAGITFTPPIDQKTKSFSFSLALNLNGSSEIQFCPLGKRTDVSLNSSWPSPSFTGAFLPDTREMNESGFSSRWNVLELNRNFPQYWMNSQHTVSGSAFGVRLLRTVDEYQKTIRTAKYAILIIALTFLAFFLSEVLAKEILHPIHYTLVGLSLVLFYLLVLALSEHLGFDLAYIISTAATVTMIGLYTLAIAVRKRISAIVSSVLLALYSFLYIVLQNEDYALLIGSIGLLVIMSLVMYLTRKVDWYAIKASQ